MNSKIVNVSLDTYLNSLSDYPSAFKDCFVFLNKEVGKSVGSIAETLFKKSEFIRNKFKSKDKFHFKLKNHATRNTKVKEKEIFIALVKSYEQFLLPFLGLDSNNAKDQERISVLEFQVNDLKERIKSIELALMKG
jgi:hypothetical protein